MIGTKTLKQIRAELKAAFEADPPGDGEVAEALRRFLATEPGKGSPPDQPKPAERPKRRPKAKRGR